MSSLKYSGKQYAWYIKYLYIESQDIKQLASWNSLPTILTGAQSESMQMPGDTRRVRDKARRRTVQYVEPFVGTQRRRFG